MPTERKQSKVKLFVENFLIYGLGGISSKIIPLVMVPIITRIMPNSSYFGISDMSHTIISFGSALAILGMYDAMYRMFFEKDELTYKKQICSTTLMFTLVTSIVTVSCMVLFRKQIARVFFKDEALAYIVDLSAVATLVGATNTIVSAPTRMQNQRMIYLIANTVGPLLSYGLSIPLLLKGYYTIALPLAGVISGATKEAAFYALNRKWFRAGLFDKKLLKQLLMIAIPLFPNFLIYWVFNSSDRLMITTLLNIGAEGIYSVGSKLGHASQLIYIAFAGGWQYFAFSTMKESDQVESNSKIFEYLGVVSFISTSFICALSYGLYKLLFIGEYIDGFIIAPYLFLAPLLQMLFQVACNQFLVIKITWPNIFILSSGAALNVVLNFILIPAIGIEGAAIATLTGYIVSDILAVIVLSRMNLMVISMRFVCAVIGIVGFLVAWRLWIPKDMLAGIAFALVYTAACVLLYKKELIAVCNRIIPKRSGN